MFLRINGWPVPVEPGSAVQTRTVLGEDRFSEQAAPILYRRKPVLSWDGRSTCRTQEDADALEGVVAGLGYRMPFDTNLFSTRGRGPIAVSGATIVAGGVFGGFCANVTSLVYDLARGPIPLLDRWTVMFFREEAAVFRLYIVRSDGAIYRDGVRDDTIPVASFLSVFDGFVTLLGAPTRFDELVALCFVATNEQCLAWDSRMRNERLPFSNLPRLNADGDIFNGRDVEVIGEMPRPQPHTMLSNGIPLADGFTLFRNNARHVPFRLHQARAAPRLCVPHPEAFFPWDTPYFATPNDIATPTNVSGYTGSVVQVDGQVGTAGNMNTGGVDGLFTSPSANFDREDNQPFGIATAVRIDESATVGLAQTIYGKLAVGITPGLWLNVTRNANDLCTVEIWMRDIAGVVGRRVTAVDAFRVGEWHHIVASYDGRMDAAGMALFVDGARVGVVTLNTAPGAQFNISVPRFGRDVGVANGMVGDLDESGFWTVQLTSADAYTLFRLASQRELSRWQGE